MIIELKNYMTAKVLLSDHGDKINKELNLNDIDGEIKVILPEEFYLINVSFWLGLIGGCDPESFTLNKTNMQFNEAVRIINRSSTWG